MYTLEENYNIAIACTVYWLYMDLPPGVFKLHEPHQSKNHSLSRTMFVIGLLHWWDVGRPESFPAAPARVWSCLSEKSNSPSWFIVKKQMAIISWTYNHKENVKILLKFFDLRSPFSKQFGLASDWVRCTFS